MWHDRVGCFHLKKEIMSECDTSPSDWLLRFKKNGTTNFNVSNSFLRLTMDATNNHTCNGLRLPTPLWISNRHLQG